MQLIRDAESVRDRLIWAIAEEDRAGIERGPVRVAVEDDLLGNILQYEPNHLVQLGMRAVIRDVQEWLEGQDVIQAKSLGAYLLAALITAGGYEDVAA